MVPLNAHQTRNPNLLHEGYSLAYPTRVGGNGQFTTAIGDECGISWEFRKESVRRQDTETINILLTFWLNGRSRRRKRTASYFSARVGDVRNGSCATSSKK